MRIGIDARLYNQTGIGCYLRNLIAQLERIDQVNDYVLYLRQADADKIQLANYRWKKKILNIPWHGIREQFVIPLLFTEDNITVAHFPYFTIPMMYSGNYLLTIHDLIIDHFDTGRASTLPAPLYRMKYLAYRLAMKRGIRRAAQIAVVSETTRQEVLDHYHPDPKLVTVTYNALDETFQELTKTYRPQKRFSFPYLLYVGNAYPHKNLECLLDALQYLLKQDRAIPMVFVGDDRYFYPRLKRRVREMGLERQVHFFGYAKEQILIDLYTHARFLIIPSLMEGFGLPVFESLACGCLPLLSDIPVFRELWETTLPMFDPHDSKAMAAGMLNVLDLPSNAYRQTVQQAAKRTEKFSWRDTAEKTLELYERIGQKK